MAHAWSSHPIHKLGIKDPAQWHFLINFPCLAINCYEPSKGKLSPYLEHLNYIPHSTIYISIGAFPVPCTNKEYFYVYTVTLYPKRAFSKILVEKCHV
jgi:hypothetical protein